MPSFFVLNSVTMPLQQALRDDAMTRAQAFHWQKMFAKARTLVEDEQRSGRPSATRTGDNSTGKTT